MAFFSLLRPHQWIKNLFIFVPLFFAKEFTNIPYLTQTIYAFLLFCLLASSVYVLNDIVDREADSKHPQKKMRPLAAGAISIPIAFVIFFILLILSFSGAYYLIPQSLPIFVIYLVFNILYSLSFKKIIILDILIISGFYILRILLGGLTTGTPVSNWLILCTLFATLFLAIGKRKAESAHEHKRHVLTLYSDSLLDSLITLSMSLAIVTYSLYCILELQSPYAIYSLFFVLFGFFRYLYLIHSSKIVESPDIVIFRDKELLMSILLWGAYMFYILYFSL